MKSFNKIKPVTWIIIILSLLLFILGLVIDDFWASNSIYKMIVLSLLSTIVSLLGVSVVGEIACKNSFAREILNLGKVTDNYIDSGIEYVYENFKDVDWNDELKGVKELTVFISYGSTWRNQNRRLIKNIGESARLIVILPDFNKEELMKELNKRFGQGNYSKNYGKASVADLIKEAAEDFRHMGAQVKLFDGTISSSYYLYNNKCIYTPFKHDVEKSDVPAIKSCAGGSYYKFCKHDIEMILAVSKEWSV